MQIRHAHADRDGAACAEIYAPFVSGTSISFEEKPPDAAELTRRIDHITSSFPWLVAEVDGSVAGFAYASRHRERAAYCWAADVSVYVGRAHHRRGIGKALYGELLELLRRQGLYTICAGITLPNAGSVALHEALGFQLVGVYRRIGYKHGQWRDVGWWQMELRPVPPGPPPAPGPPQRLGG
jgi:L-amino acid N-acyltransferase YncA